jgi:hypothetical protein
MQRRTKIQRETHLIELEDKMVRGVPRSRIAREMREKHQLTSRQVRHDLRQLFRRWERKDDLLLSERAARRELAAAVDRREHEWNEAVASGDPRRSAEVEKDRAKLLGLYADERKRRPYVTNAERRLTAAKLQHEVLMMYAEAPTNPDGSVVLTAYSRSPPPQDDVEYREAIENPKASTGGGSGTRANTGGASGTRPVNPHDKFPGRKLGDRWPSDRGDVVSPRRQERVDELREALAEGTHLDQLEELARQRFGLSQRAARRHVVLLMRQLEEDGERIRQGTHELQALTLAMRRRNLLADMAAQKKDEALLKDLEIERSKLLGLYAKDRRDSQKPLPDEEENKNAERMIEIEFARLDRERGHRHTTDEMIAGPNGEPTTPGRQPFKPPAPEDWDPESPYPSAQNDDWLTRDLGPEWDDTLREDDYDYVPPPETKESGVRDQGTEERNQTSGN